ncbi:MAG: restriction endonuclease [Methylomonas sp.]|nr:restriction endonuclease [Methylomonas sp.]
MPGIFSSLKNWFSDNPSQPVKPKAETPAEREARHRKDALAFVKQKHREASNQQSQKTVWHHQYGKQKAAELSQLSGTEFEAYLAGLFRQHGYQVEMTPITGDYGADLLLTKDGKRIAVQAKCYSGSVGVSAVQEALAGMAYYGCQSAWVVTTGNLTPNAIELANKSSVRLVDTTELGKLIRQLEDKDGRK